MGQILFIPKKYWFFKNSKKLARTIFFIKTSFTITIDNIQACKKLETFTRRKSQISKELKIYKIY